MATKNQRRDALAKKNAAATQFVAQVTQTTMTGPLPSPEMLEAYERASPGAASIIVGRFQSQSVHRMAQESRIVMSDIVRAYIGQITGGGLAVYLIYTGGDLLRHGQSLIGFQSIGLAIGLGAVPFTVRAIAQHRERKSQTEAIAKQQRLNR